MGRVGIRGMRRAIVMVGALTGGTLFLGAQSLAAKVYRLEGKVTRLSSDALTVEDERSHDQLEFARGAAGLELPKQLKVGDRVNLWYTLDAQKLHLVRGAGAPEPQAGQAGEGTEEGEGLPLKPQVDDRLFFNADSGLESVPGAEPSPIERARKRSAS